MQTNTPNPEAEAPVNDHAVRVGAAIRKVRNDQGLSLRALADKCGLSSGFLSLAERGVSALSLTSLFALAEALGVDAVVLLGATETPLEKSYVVRRHDSPDNIRVVMGDREHFVLSGDLPDQKLEALRTTVSPTENTPEMTKHDGEEFCYVLDGELTFTFTDGEAILRAGDSIHFTSSKPHSVHNDTQTPTKTLWIVDRPLLHRT
ncbi:helix-turn-helix domain-containing protein [Brevibacterium aurantiacum]|uniref:helix-turn-helix domain-containing protein n=1 Tax=Brevibacterium aurantiacum TaxID=273384 RepID=UPI00084CC4CE|nr:cupin domain-containing protein [Brevibacterium aurantiacum]RCS98877.1 cupin domain-containing protein [Brevibacterium aurantiacum]